MKLQTHLNRSKQVLASLGLAFSLIIPATSAAAAAQVNPQQDQLFEAAAQEFGVPKELLVAISYSQTRLKNHDGPSVDGGFGLMDLAGDTPREDGRGKHEERLVRRSNRQHTLDEAAKLLGVSPDTLKRDDRQNVRAGAALLREYARQLHGKTPTRLSDWYDIVAKYSGDTTTEGAQSAADEVYTTLQNGASARTTEGQVQIQANPDVRPRSRELRNLRLRSRTSGQNPTGAECPSTIVCRFVPAGYAQNSADPADFGNYDHANRPRDMKIKYIVVHDTEGSYQSAINHFQNTNSYVSCNYIIRSSDGDVTQMVRNQDVGWCAGDWYVNMHSINIEHEAFAAQGATWYTEAMYQSSAKLVRYLAEKYGIPLDREHIIGHDEVPTISPTRMAGQHWDPGPYWDWNHYMALLHGVSDEAERAQSAIPQGSQQSVTIAPSFATNTQVFTDCSSGTCLPLPSQGSSHLKLHTSPDEASPLLSDKYLHPDGAAGTDQIGDWGPRALSGKRYALAAQQGEWMGIWYGGTIGWFRNSAATPTAYLSKNATVTPRAGLASVPVYGAAYPEASAYPSGVPVQTLQPLYTFPAGQTYVTTAERLPIDYFYDATIDYSLPHDHEVIVGNERYYQISFNKRVGYVKAADVNLAR